MTKDFADYQDERFLNRAQGVADSLRRIAERVEIEIRTARPGASRSQLAASIYHEVMWGLANISIETLIVNASDADAARGAES